MNTDGRNKMWKMGLTAEGLSVTPVGDETPPEVRSLLEKLNAEQDQSLAQARTENIRQIGFIVVKAGSVYRGRVYYDRESAEKALSGIVWHSREGYEVRPAFVPLAGV